jgi:hypothetical protein
MVAAEQSVEKPNGTPDTDPLNDQSKNNLLSSLIYNCAHSAHIDITRTTSKLLEPPG